MSLQERLLYRNNNGVVVYACSVCGRVPSLFYLEVDASVRVGHKKRQLVPRCGSIYVCSAACANVAREACGKRSYALVSLR